MLMAGFIELDDLDYQPSALQHPLHLQRTEI